MPCRSKRKLVHGRSLNSGGLKLPIATDPASKPPLKRYSKSNAIARSGPSQDMVAIFQDRFLDNKIRAKCNGMRLLLLPAKSQEIHLHLPVGQHWLMVIDGFQCFHPDQSQTEALMLHPAADHHRQFQAVPKQSSCKNLQVQCQPGHQVIVLWPRC